MATFHFELVAPERVLYSGEVDAVMLPGTEGDMTVLPGHAPVMTGLKTGFIAYEWVKDPAQANEGLDTHLQAEAAAIKLGLRAMPDRLWDRYEAERETPAPEGDQLDLEDMLAAPAAAKPRAPSPAAAPTKAPAKPQPKARVRRSSFMDA